MRRRYGALDAGRRRDGHPARAAMLLVVGLVSSTFALAPGARADDTFVVNSTADDPDASLADNICATAAGECTLRAAIQQSNNDADTDTINFDITPNTISPGSSLPEITSPVIIDGNSDPDPGRVELDGSLAGAGASGLSITSGRSTVRGLVINDFDFFGVVMFDLGADANVIEDNWIGTDVTGTTAQANGTGVDIDLSSENTVRNNLISGNDGEGLHIGRSVRNQVEGNTIGTDITGTADLGNGEDGVEIVEADDNTVEENLISGNDGNGIRILESTRNFVGHNAIGTDRTASIDLGNAGDGVLIDDGPDNELNENLISGNDGSGVFIVGAGATGNLVQDNKIGTDGGGATDLGNTQRGVAIEGAAGNTVSSSTISGNFIGVLIDGPGATGNVVQRNRIGTDHFGTIDLGNDNVGVFIDDAADNLVGGAGDGNVISGNPNGVVIQGAAATGNVVQNNRIGTDLSGTVAVGNDVGVFINLAPNNMVGGTASQAGNRIAFNSLDGVRVLGAGAVGNSILSNSIESNGELGIDLDPNGPTLNDPGDADAGPNDLQNFPELTNVTLTSVAGTLNSEPNKAYRIEVFESANPDPSGFGEGATFLGAVDVMTDGAGDAAFNFPLAVSPGSFVTTTATALNSPGSTSEFSRALQAPGAPPSGADLSITKVDSPDPVRVGGTVTYTLTVRNDGPDPATGVVVTDALPAGVDFISADATQGTCAQAGSTVTCNLGSLAPSATATVTIKIQPTEVGTITDTASVTANETDPDEANNSDTETTTVKPERDYDADEPDNEFDFDSPFNFNTDTTGPGDSNGDAAGYGTPTGTSTVAPTGGADPVPDPVTQPLPTVSGTDVLGDALGWLDDAATAPSPSSALAQGAGGSDVGAGYGELPRTGGEMAPLATGFLLLATACRAARRRWRA